MVRIHILLLKRKIIAALTTLCCIALHGGPIHEAARTGNLPQVQELLRVTPALANDQQADGSTPLHEAARCGQKVVINLMGHVGELGSMECVGFQVLLERACEWAETGKCMTSLPKNFPSAEVTSLAP